MSKIVIDLSKWSSTKIDWKTLKENVDGVIVRAGYRGFNSPGRISQDTNFKTFANKCAKYKIPFGVYWFAQEISKEEAIESANYVANLIAGYKISYPIYYDVESSGAPYNRGRADYLCNNTRTDCIVAFCEEIKKLGYIPGVYANEHWFNTKIVFGRVKNYSIWCAKYNKNNGIPGIPPMIKYDMWQYTDKGSILGITHYVDMSLDEGAFIKNGFNESNNNTQKSIEDIARDVIKGKYGNGPARKKALISEGYNYTEVQAKVTELIGLLKGDKVKLKSNATYSNGDRIPQWVKSSTLFVRGETNVNGDVPVSTVQSGEITGIINKKYLIKL